MLKCHVFFLNFFLCHHQHVFFLPFVFLLWLSSSLVELTLQSTISEHLSLTTLYIDWHADRLGNLASLLLWREITLINVIEQWTV